MSRYDTAPYDVLEKDGVFEIRRYGPFFTAAVKESDLVETRGFNQVFSYINGNNADREKISMTVPVINDLNESHKTTEFVMPSQFNESGPPDPTDSRVEIRKYEQRLVAAITFSGNVDSNKISKFKNQLLDWLAKTEWKPTGDFLMARYNSPFTLPVFRRNEILAVLE